MLAHKRLHLCGGRQVDPPDTPQLQHVGCDALEQAAVHSKLQQLQIGRVDIRRLAGLPIGAAKVLHAMLQPVGGLKA
eukprot:7378099-Prymnesium_polylepis.1